MKIGANSPQLLVHISPTLGELELIKRIWWALRVLIDLVQYLNHIYLIFLDLAPILVNWSDILEYGSKLGRI